MRLTLHEVRRVGKGACDSVARCDRCVAPCPPAALRWAWRDRPCVMGKATPGAFAHPTRHLFAPRFDQYTDKPAPSVAPSPWRLASSKHARARATSGISTPHLAPSANMMRRSLMQL